MKAKKQEIDIDGYWLDCDFDSGACYSFENGKKHLFYAEIAGTQKDYGIGVSHCVLSIEELIKSMVLISCYVYRYWLTNEEKRMVFTRHDFKQSNIKELLSSLSAKNINAYHANPFDFIDGEAGNKFQTIAHFLSVGLKLGTLDEDDVKDLIDLVNKANDYKNRGFYVDYKEKWIIPDSTSKEKFCNYHALTKRILTFIEPIFVTSITDDRFQKFI